MYQIEEWYPNGNRYPFPQIDDSVQKLSCPYFLLILYFTITIQSFTSSIESPLQSKHMPPRQQVHDDDPVSNSHKQLLQFEAGDSPNLEAHAAKHKGYRKTRNLGNPSDILETQPSDTLRQKVYYERQAVNPLLEVLFAPILSGILVHPQYHPGRVHAPENTNSYNSSALAG
jgi:hypothetical protein